MKAHGVSAVAICPGWCQVRRRRQLDSLPAGQAFRGCRFGSRFGARGRMPEPMRRASFCQNTDAIGDADVIPCKLG